MELKRILSMFNDLEMSKSNIISSDHWVFIFTYVYVCVLKAEKRHKHTSIMRRSQK